MKTRHLPTLSFGLILLFLCSCSQPTDFSRDNEFDPGSMSYVPEGPDTVVVNFYSEELLEIKWFDHSFTQQKYTLERKIDDDNFEIIKEFEIAEPEDSTVYLDTASIYGSYTYRVTGFYPDRSIQSNPSKPLEVKNWLRVMPGKYRSGDLVALDKTRILAYSNEGAEIYSHETLSWEEIDLSFCQQKVSETKKQKDGNIAVLCTSDELAEGEIGVFIFKVKEEVWSLAGKLNRKVQNFEMYKTQPSIISLSNNKMLVVGYSNWDKGYTIIADLFDPQTKETVSVDPDLENQNVYLIIHDSSPDPIGIELLDNRVLVSCGLEVSSGGKKNLIFNPFEKSWELTSNHSYVEFSDIELLKDGRVIAVNGTSSFFSGVLYDPETKSWELKSHQTYWGYAKKLVKISNGNVFSIDSGGNVYLFDIEIDAWRRLQNQAEPGFNFQYSSVTVYRDNVIILKNSYSKSSYIYRPSPEEKHYFE